MRQLYCIDGKNFSKTAIRGMIDSGDWPTPLSDHLREQCATVAQYNIASLNAEDIIDQKNLYIKALTSPSEYDKGYFSWNLGHSSLTHYSNTPECMRYLRIAANSEVTAESGIWRLWYAAKDVPRAEVVYKESMKGDPDEEERIQHNVDNTLDNRKEGKPNPLEEALDDTVQRES